MVIPGIHHITAISGTPRVNYDFYTGVLGLRMVKKTVNFDDPQTYHLYYGDETGTPGTLLTFFPFENAYQGKAGSGMANRIGFAVPEDSFDWWVDRIAQHVERFDPPAERFGRPVLTFQDPDGLMLEIMPLPGVETLPGWQNGEVPRKHSIRSFANATLLLEDATHTGKLLKTMGYEMTEQDGIFQRYVAGSAVRSADNDNAGGLSGAGDMTADGSPDTGDMPAEGSSDTGDMSTDGSPGADDGSHAEYSSREEGAAKNQSVVAPFLDLQIQPGVAGRMGKGTIHHVAFRAKDEQEQLRWREEFIKVGLQPTNMVDRQYFKSIYFREPGGVLFEVATDPPGMLIDEPKASLGESLRLPPWYEDRRDQIEANLPFL